MSALAAIIGTPANSHALQALLEGQQARAAGDSATEQTDQVQLGLRSRQGAAEILRSADGRFLLAAEARLHAVDELAAALAAAGVTTPVNEDAALLLQVMETWGLEGLDRVAGAWALALHDTQENTLTLARDPFGMAPLFWTREAGSGAVLAASHLPALAVVRAGKKQLEESIAYAYLRDGALDEGERTLLTGVHRVRPGCAVVIDGQGEREVAVSTLAEELRRAAEKPGKPANEQAVAQLRAALEQARDRLVPAGSTVGVLEDGSLAAHTVQALATTGCERVVSVGGTPRPESVVGDLPVALERQGEPTASLTDLVRAEYAARGGASADLLLDSLGADEVLRADGCPMQRMSRLRQERRFGDLAQELIGSRREILAGARARLTGYSPVPVNALLNNSFVAAQNESSSAAPLPGTPRARAVEQLLSRRLPAQLRVRERAAAAAGVRSASPFLDRGVLLMLLGLEESAMTRGGVDRWILREATAGLLPPAVRKTAGGPTPLPEREGILALAPQMREVFASQSFAERGIFDAPTVRALFADFEKRPEMHDSRLFWRLFSLELWLRTVVDDEAAQETHHRSADAVAAKNIVVKSDYEPNEGKNLDYVSTVDQRTWRRFPLQTDLVTREDDVAARVVQHVQRFVDDMPADAMPEGAPWMFVISEKIVAITQGRSWYTWEVQPRPAARVLSRFVTRTPAGIGLGDPTTMELAIREAGLGRVVVAAVAGAAGKVVGKRGVFYEVVGDNVRAIDGPTVYSAFPSNVSAKLPPKDPAQVAARISAAVRGMNIPESLRSTFRGTVVMDANDIGRNVLGTDVTAYSQEELEETFGDNPLGQGRQRTPMAIVVDLGR